MLSVGGVCFRGFRRGRGIGVIRVIKLRKVVRVIRVIRATRATRAVIPVCETLIGGECREGVDLSLSTRKVACKHSLITLISLMTRMTLRAFG